MCSAMCWKCFEDVYLSARARKEGETLKLTDRLEWLPAIRSRPKEPCGDSAAMSFGQTGLLQSFRAQERRNVSSGCEAEL